MFSQRYLLRAALNSLTRSRNIRRNYEPGTRTYEGDGKTSATVLNNEENANLMINSFSTNGFRLNNGMLVIGPLALFNKTVVSWNISDFTDINEQTLSLFTILEPKVDVLVIGIGDGQVTPEISKKLIYFMRKFNINVEVLPTEQACATFNFLNSEGRMAAAALIPPLALQISEADYVSFNINRRKVLEIED